jgi:threonine dehydratase
LLWRGWRVRLGIAATAVVPENALEVKLRKLRTLGRTHRRALERRMVARNRGGCDSPTRKGLYIDAVRDPASLAGDATIGRRGISRSRPMWRPSLFPSAAARSPAESRAPLRAIRASVKVIACELATAHPLKAAFAAGAPVQTPHEPGFVNQRVGYGCVLPEMWPLARSMIHGVITV